LAASAGGYAEHPEARRFIDSLVQEGFERAYLQNLMQMARRQESILEAISRPAEKRLSWGEYRNIFLGRSRIRQGVEFWNAHEKTLARAAEIYGVAPSIIVAIIGVETRYGRQAGGYRVLDALTTLGFDYPPRAEFFRGQLRELLYLLREETFLQPLFLKGSYAGAMGYGQFIPSSYRDFAVDFDGDGQRNILTDPVDVIGSVANYFNQHGWRAGEPVTVPATIQEEIDPSLYNGQLKPERTLTAWRELGVQPQRSLTGDERATLMKLEAKQGSSYWLGLHNFYVITRYNHSHLYAMAVYELSREIMALRETEKRR
jgi:membrane-bound lytic murein transglycosylase B